MRVKLHKTDQKAFRNDYFQEIIWETSGGFSGSAIVEVPPDGRLLCERCEMMAVAAGELSASKLAGKHVHVGRMVPRRTCCRGKEN